MMTPRARSALLCSLLMLGLVALPASAQWKWRDKSGRITVSDIPPPRDIAPGDILQRLDPAAAQRTAAPAAAPASVAAATKPPVDPELQARKKATEQEQAAKAAEDEERQRALRDENCRNARAHLNAMESGQRMARVNDKGEREILDDKQRAAESMRARQVIQSDCR